MGELMSKLTTVLQVGRTFGMRDGMLRLEYELRRSSGLLSWKMKSVQGWDSWHLNRIAPGVSAKEMLAAHRNGTRLFFFSDAQTLASNLKNVVGVDGEKEILAEAERILAGNVPFFGHLSFASGFPPRWFENPVTGHSVSPQQSWTQMRFASPVYGDLKFILESSRFLFVYPLVRAYALSGDERYPHAFWRAIEDWTYQSPPMTGPLWICGQECSLRILALSFALHGFIHSPSTTNNRVALLVSMIAAHAWRTAQTLGYARSQRSNHLISEAVGLWTAGTLYPELREALVWRNLGAHLLQKAVLDQITLEGVSQQHSFNYQRMILHLLLWTLRLAEIHGAPLHEDIRARAQAAFEFMRAWVDPVSGSAPKYGSDDGSLILPLSLGSYRDFRPLLQLGATVLNRPALEPGLWDEATLWLGMKPAALKVAKEDKGALPFAEIGYFRLGDHNSWALIRAGRYTRRPFQADQLHVDLWWQGINIARDAGTYLYNGPPPWNNGFAGTAVHNTVTLDNRDQMRRAGRFLWLDWAQARGRLLSSNDQAYADRFEGEHDGYINFGVKHRRMVQWLSAAGWVIVDDIEGAGSHDVRLHWLTPDLPYEFSEAPLQVTFNSAQGQIRWNIFSSVPGDALVVRAAKRTETASANEFTDADIRLLGWESSTYGDLRPAVSLVYQTRSQLPVRFVTVVLTDERCRVETSNGQIVILKPESQQGQLGESELHRVNLSIGRTDMAKDLLSPSMQKRIARKL
jgi:Heparinase II/III-like protein/Heparinase II/III N-terminus